VRNSSTARQYDVEMKREDFTPSDAYSHTVFTSLIASYRRLGGRRLCCIERFSLS